MFWVRPFFIMFYIRLTIFLLLIVNESISFWISIEDWVWVNPDLDNIPRRAERFLGKPEAGKLKDDITSLTGLDSFKVNPLLLGVENLGNLNTLACNLTIGDAG